MKNETNPAGLKKLPAAERPREKLLANGVWSLSDSELLALLIGSGTQRESALTLASRVLALEPEGLGLLAAYTPEEFMKIPGIGEAKSCVLAAAIELGRRIASAPAAVNPVIDSPAAAAGLYMEEMRRLPKEIFRVLHLNAKSQLVMKEDISVGGISSSFSHPREVFAGAVKRGAYAVILMHNHPSGDPTPSEADISATRILCQAGEVLGIQVMDHILIGDGRYRSLKEDNLM